MIYNFCSAIDKIDDFFTERFSGFSSFLSFGTLAILFSGIIIGVAICFSIYSVFLFKSVNKQEKLITKNEKENNPLVAKAVEEIKQSFIDETEGLSVRERFEVLSGKITEEVLQIATIYYPDSKYPMYELTIEEMILLLHYLSNRIDGVFESPVLKPFKKLSLSKIFDIIETKKHAEETKIVKVSKQAHLGKIGLFINGAVRAINPLYWIKKLVVSSSINVATRKISLIILDIVADETNKTYNKSLFDKEKSIRQLEIEQLLNEIEEEANA